jgi:soluble lytic murein transglycosylase-like protein
MNVFDIAGTLRARAHQGLKAAPVGRGRKVAIAIGISRSMALPLDAQASNQAIRYVKDLAKYQLTDKQEACHHEIIYRESRWDHRAVGNIGGKKQAYGLYQMKVESLKNGSTVKQFWMYWTYVMHRYGVTQYDEPDYCKALHHLKTKGWQ